jgi:hypothetical protein
MLIITDYSVHSLRTDTERDGTNYRRDNERESLGEVINTSIGHGGWGDIYLLAGSQASPARPSVSRSMTMTSE